MERTRQVRSAPYSTGSRRGGGGSGGSGGGGGDEGGVVSNAGQSFFSAVFQSAQTGLLAGAGALQTSLQVGVGAVQTGLQAGVDAVKHRERLSSIVGSFMEIARVYRRTQSVDEVGRRIREEAVRLGGVVRKSAQQLGSRPDVVPLEQIREALGGLLADNEPRARRVIEEQMLRTLRVGSEFSMKAVLKAGTMGEVSIVEAAADGATFALKTINLDQKSLFSEDFAIFQGSLMPALTVFFTFVENISPRLRVVKQLIAKVVDLVKDPLFQKHIMDEFDLRIEAENMVRATGAVTAACRALGLPDGRVWVPSVIESARNGDTLLMQFVEGQNLKDWFPKHAPASDASKRVALDLLGVFLHGLLSGPLLHADLHPGNILYGEGRLALVDWGLVVSPPAGQRHLVHRLLRLIHRSGGVGGDSVELKDLFLGVGVQVRDAAAGDAREEHYLALKDFFDIVSGACEELDVARALEFSQLFDLPEWVKLWQKATSALVTSLSWLRVGRADLDQHLRAVLEQLRPPANDAAAAPVGSS